MSNHQAVAEQPKLTFIQKCKTMRGQQLICTVVFLIAPLLLNYDFTFLALLLWEPEEDFTPCRGRCYANPLRRLPMCPESRALEEAADESVILSWWKLRDSVQDEGFWRGLPARALSLVLRPACRRAARRCPAAGIAVASVYRLPLADASVDVLVDCFSPLAAAEFARTLRPGGVFLYVVPGPRHLWELKELLYEKPYENEEKEETYPGFSLERAVPVESVFTLTRKEDVMALFGMTPYAWKTPREAVERLAQAEELTVTAQFRIHTLRRK